MKAATLTTKAEPEPVCNCLRRFFSQKVSSVKHKNHCPVKQEAILRLHLTKENPCMQTG